VATTSADGDVIELAWAGGRARVSARGPDQAVRGLLAELGVEPPEPLSLSWESAFHVLNVKEMFSYDRTSPTAEGLFEKGRRQAPSEEIVYLMEAAHRWSMGQMPANAVPRTIPDGISSRTASHLQAVVALADGDPERARALVGEWPNLTPTTWDGRWTEAMFRLVAGELMFHGGDPQRGIALLEDALALDPSLEAPTYHLLRHHLARADYAAVATVSSIIARHQPSAAVPADFRLRALLAKGDYAAARRGYEQMLGGSRDAPENLEGAQIGLLYALAMTEPLADALRHAETVAADRIKEPGVAAVMPEPVVYALALARGDAALRDAWARRLRDKLVPPWTANRELLVHTVTILDHLAGRAPRWPAPVGVADRTYRFRRQRDLARALAARAAGDLAALDAIGEAAIDPEVRALVAGVAARVRGDPARAIADFETALEQSADGELDCVAAGWLAEAQRAVGDERAASESCRRVLQPRIPTPYCFVIPACARAR
jgi:tetratricopeptide (TPR) repeat protein